jgi:hypothetical protein
MPEPPDYPECLKHLLHRRIEKSSLGEISSILSANPTAQYFIKPYADTKAFSGLTVSPDWMDYLLGEFSSSFPVIMSELVEMVSEYRVYIVNGEIKAICRYKGPDDGALDLDVVRGAVETLSESDEGREIIPGCGADFATVRISPGDERLVTALIEVNDGYSLGAYDGLSGKDYTDMLIGRWRQLMK